MDYGETGKSTCCFYVAVLASKDVFIKNYADSGFGTLIPKIT